MRAAIRIILLVLLAPPVVWIAAALLDLNIQKLAEEEGWDNFLVSAFKSVPTFEVLSTYWLFWLGTGLIAGATAYAWLIRFIPEPLKWKETAELVLVFDALGEHASPTVETNIMHHVWVPLLATQNDGQATKRQALVFVFVTFDYPAHTNYQRVEVVGGGIPAVLMADNSSGAVVRFDGDLRGRTVRLRFSKRPIPLS